MVAPYKAEDTQLVVGLESSQASTVTPTEVLGKVVEDATMPDPEQEWIVQRVIGGDRETFQKEQGNRTYEGGDIPVVLQDGHPVAYALGNDSVSGSGPYTHTLTPKMDGLPPTQTLEATYYGRGGGSDFVRTFAGATPNECTLEMNNDDELTASLSYYAMGVSTGAAPTTGISVPGTNPWLFADASSKLSLFGTTFARFQDFSLSISNNLDPGRYIAPDSAHPTGDSRDPYELTYGNVEYELSTTVVIEDDSLYQELISPTAGGFQSVIEFQRGGSGDLFRITCDGCNFSETPHEVPGESGKVEVEGTIDPDSLTIEVESSDSTAWV
jgi:hypothetical protein